MKNIIITKTNNRYNAEYIINPQDILWGHGKSIPESIGDLISKHKYQFEINIIDLVETT